MLFFLWRLLLLALIGLAVYCFWPRKPSIVGFDPVKIAELQTTVWRLAEEKRPVQSMLVPLYKMYQQQFGMPPITSLKMAFDHARALQVFHNSRDAADQDKAILPLQTLYHALRAGTHSGFDANAVARLQLTLWMLRSDHAKRAELTTAWTDYLALIFGRSTADVLPAAKKFSIACKLAAEGKWTEVRSGVGEAWALLKPAPPM